MWALRNDENIVVCTLDPLIVRLYWDLYEIDLRIMNEELISPVKAERPVFLDEDRSVVLGFDKKKLASRIKKAEAEVRFVTNFELRK